MPPCPFCGYGDGERPCPYVAEWMGDGSDDGHGAALPSPRVIAVVPLPYGDDRSAVFDIIPPSILGLCPRAIPGLVAGAGGGGWAGAVWGSTRLAMFARRRTETAQCLSLEKPRLFRFIVVELLAALAEAACVADLTFATENDVLSFDEAAAAWLWLRGHVRDVVIDPSVSTDVRGINLPDEPSVTDQ